MSLNDAEYTLRANHLRTVGARYRLAFLRRNLVGPLLLAAAGTQSAHLVGDLPDTILVCDQHVIIAPGEDHRAC